MGLKSSLLKSILGDEGEKLVKSVSQTLHSVSGGVGLDQQAMFESEFKKLSANMNSQLGTQFQFKVDWAILNDYIKWNWHKDDLANNFKHSFFVGLQSVLGKMLEDSFYKKAITEQVHTLHFVSGPEMGWDFDFKEGTLFIKHKMSVNHRNLDQATSVKYVKNNLHECIDKKLS